MSRLLFWIALIILVVMAVRAKLREATAMRQPPRRTANPAAPAVEQGESMACCAHCGLYFPVSEAVSADGRDYCCPAHVRLPPK
jgi:uncharacterized protein